MWRTHRTLFNEFARLNRDFDRLFTSTVATNNFPAMNVWRNEDKIVISAEIPGLSPDDIDISLEGTTLTISGQRERADLPENARYLRRERVMGNFHRAFHLPYGIDAEGVNATFKNGILSIDLPRAEAEKPRKIAVAVN